MTDNAATPPGAAADLSATPDVSSITSEQAGELLKQLTAEFQRRQGAPDVFGLSPQEADAKLAELAKQAAKAAADPIGAALDGTLPTDGITTTGLDGGLAPRKMIDTVADLRERGVADEAIRQVLDGWPVSRQEYEDVKSLQRERHGDKEWVRRLLDGDSVAKLEQTLMSVVLTSSIAGAK